MYIWGQPSKATGNTQEWQSPCGVEMSVKDDLLLNNNGASERKSYKMVVH